MNELAEMNQTELMKAIARLVESGDLYIVRFQPPGYPDMPMELSLASSSPTAWREVLDAVKK
jgi:hypothetical protein